jgi:hypothetical protein
MKKKIRVTYKLKALQKTKIKTPPESELQLNQPEHQLHCTTTWCQPGLNRGLVDLF